MVPSMWKFSSPAFTQPNPTCSSLTPQTWLVPPASQPLAPSTGWVNKWLRGCLFSKLITLPTACPLSSSLDLKFLEGRYQACLIHPRNHHAYPLARLSLDSRNICSENTCLKAFMGNSLTHLGGAPRSMRTEGAFPALSLPAGKPGGLKGGCYSWGLWVRNLSQEARPGLSLWNRNICKGSDPLLELFSSKVVINFKLLCNVNNLPGGGGKLAPTEVLLFSLKSWNPD